jgi:hypothetical protein
VPDYGLDDRAIEVRYPAKAKIFPLASAQTVSGAHPTFSPMDNMSPFPEDKAQPRCDPDHSPPHIVEVKNLLSLQQPPWRVAGLIYFTISFILFSLKDF